MRNFAIVGLLLVVSVAEAHPRFRTIREAPYGLEALRRATELPEVRHALRQGKKITLSVKSPTADDVQRGQIESVMSGRWSPAGKLRSFGLVLGVAGRVHVVERTQELWLNGRGPTMMMMSADELTRQATPRGTSILRREGLNPKGWEFQWKPETVKNLLLPTVDMVRALDYESVMRLQMSLKDLMEAGQVADALERSL